MKKLIERITTTLGKPFAYLGAEWERMAPRERRLVGALLGVVVGLVVVVGGYLYFDSISSLAEHNADTREALSEIARNKKKYLDAKSKVRAQELRIGKDPPQITADLETAAREVGVQLPETNERPNTPLGKLYVQHDVDVKLRQVDLASLSKFLVKVETGQRLIVITRLDVRRRFAEGDKLDVELTATAYERLKEEARPKKGKAATKEKT